MIQIDDSNIKSIREGIAILRQKETEIHNGIAMSRLQSYNKDYSNKWVKLYHRDIETYEPDYSSTEFILLKVKSIKSASEVTSFQDSLELECIDGTYLSIDEDNEFDGNKIDLRIRELGYWGDTITAYSNCIEIIKPDELNQYIEILQNKINKILNAK